MAKVRADASDMRREGARGPGGPTGDARVLLAIGSGVAVVATMVLAPRIGGEVGNRATLASVSFVSLFAQSLPFLLAGAAIATLLRSRVGDRLFASAKRNPKAAIVIAPLTGVVLPLCDCGLVPVARQIGSVRRLRPAVSGFVAGAPLTNPIVIITTAVAFPGNTLLIVGRVVVGVAVAMIASRLVRLPRVRTTTSEHPHEHGAKASVLGDLAAELATTGPVLVAGALAAGWIRAFLPPGLLTSFDAQPLVGAIVMMALAFLIAICAQADAFFAAALPVGNLAHLTFMVLGPMLDIRLAMLYRREFGGRWLRSYAVVVVPSVLVLCTVWVTFWGSA